MVTPISLNGAGCAAAVPAVMLDANNKATNTVVFMDASLLSWIFLLTDAMRSERSQPAFKISRTLRCLKGKLSPFTLLNAQPHNILLHRFRATPHSPLRRSIATEAFRLVEASDQVRSPNMRRRGEQR